MAPLPTALSALVQPSVYQSHDHVGRFELPVSSPMFDELPPSIHSPSPDTSSYLSALGLFDPSKPTSPTKLFRRLEPPTSPLVVHDLNRRAAEPASTLRYGEGTLPPDKLKNEGFLALFALIGAGMVVGSIWFFFWAKNGGFVFRKGDWEDYKSTVLRRKGPDGKTLSNATKSTNLGHGSMAGTFSDDLQDEMVEVRNVDGRKRGKYKDRDVQAYRQEKPARVGGLNRAADGSHFDYSNTNRSDIVSEASGKPLVPAVPSNPRAKEKKKGFMEKKREERQEKRDAKAAAAEKKKKPMHAARPSKPQRSAPSAAYSFMAGDDTATVISSMPETVTNPSTSYIGQAETRRSASNSYYDDYRPNAAPASYSEQYQQARRSHRNSPAHTPTSNRSRQSSPRKHSRRHDSSRGAAETLYARPTPNQGQRSNRNSRYTDDISEASYFTEPVSDTGTKVYEHHIPGLSKGPNDSGRRGRDVMAGYRREGAARRDSLSDSEGESGTTRF